MMTTVGFEVDRISTGNSKLKFKGSKFTIVVTSHIQKNSSVGKALHSESR